VILTGVNVNAATGHFPQPFPVGRDCRRVVTHPMAQVHSVKGRPAAIPHSTHNNMDQSLDTQKWQELKQIIVLFL
jgi:hypothetical protein